jgi:hypothetical protein
MLSNEPDVLTWLTKACSEHCKRCDLVPVLLPRQVFRPNEMQRGMCDSRLRM